MSVQLGDEVIVQAGDHDHPRYVGRKGTISLLSVDADGKAFSNVTMGFTTLGISPSFLVSADEAEEAPEPPRFHETEHLLQPDQLRGGEAPGAGNFTDVR